MLMLCRQRGSVASNLEVQCRQHYKGGAFSIVREKGFEAMLELQ